MTFQQIWQFDFLGNALLAGILLAVSASLLGMHLLLRKMALLGDSIAHISFGAIACGLLIGVFPLFTALPIVIAATLFILQLSQKRRLFSDTAIAIVSSVGLAGGVLIASLAQGFNIELMSYLFGNILTVSRQELWLTAGLSLLIVVFMRLFHWQLFALTFDEEQARTLFSSVDLLNRLFIILTAITIVLMIRLAGALLVSALLILPGATALQVSSRFQRALLLTVTFAISAVIAGMLLAVVFDFPVGATIVLTNFLFFLLSLLLKKLQLRF